MKVSLRRITLAAAPAAAICLLLTIGTHLYTKPGEAPGFAAVRAAHDRSESAVLDRHGDVIHELRTDRNARRLDWVSLNEISPAFRSAALAAEDKRFFTHGGVDWTSLAGVLAGTIRGGGMRGASTITMQLVSILDSRVRPEASRRSLAQKIRQLRSARSLEGRWSKDEILEAYLNLVGFRGELQGVAAAASGLFGKKPHGLDDQDGLILASLIRAPNAGAEQVAARARLLAGSMKLGLGDSALTARAREVLGRPYFIRPEAQFAPHAARILLPEGQERRAAPDRVKSTLDGRLQRFAAEVLRHHLAGLASQNVRDGAVLVADNATGDVLAYVGGPGGLGSARHVDGVQALRQAGSTLKPILYGLAFEQRILTAASLIDDSPLDVPVLGGIYRPKNYDRNFHGLVTARTALAASLNVPAVKVLDLVGIDPLVRRLDTFGFRRLQEADFYGPSLALGSADVTLWDLVHAYRALANRGLAGPLRLSPDDERPPFHRVLSEAAAFLVSDILSDRASRSVTFSLESPLATRYWTAVKTGTSKDMRDNWCIGYSTRYTAGVWVGNFGGEPMWDVSGITGAAPVWVEIMNRLHHGQAGAPPEPPAEMAAADVALPGLQEGTRREWFIRGTEAAVVTPASDPGRSRILYPAEGTVVALDPDIPPRQQKLFLEASPEGRLLFWVLNGTRLGPAASLTLWTPSAGKHTLALVGAGGEVKDSIQFEVRGNTPPK